MAVRLSLLIAVGILSCVQPALSEQQDEENRNTSIPPAPGANGSTASSETSSSEGGTHSKESLEASAPDAAEESTREGQAAASTTQVSESAKKEAAERFQRGLEFYEDGDYGLALIEFERAYQLVPDYRVLYNIGQVSIQLSRSSQALRALENYLEAGRGELEPERIEAVERDLEMLRERTAHLDIKGPKGAQVFVDEERLGTLPLSTPLLLDAGRHRVEVTLDGHDAWNQRITLAGAESLELQAALRKKASPAVLLPQQPAQNQPVPAAALDAGPAVAVEASSPPYALIGWTTTGALASGALFSGVMGFTQKNKLKELKTRPDPSSDELQRRSRSASSWFAAADVLGLAAITSGGVSLYFTLRPAEQEETAKDSLEKKRILSGSFARQTPHDWKIRIEPQSVKVSKNF